MTLKAKGVALILSALFGSIFVHDAFGTDDDDDKPAATAAATNSVNGGNTRYGLFDWLDHRSAYTQEVFPEPFLVDDMALEDNEIELTYMHTKGDGLQSDSGSVELQKGFGLLTLQVEVPYEANQFPGGTAQGFGSIDLGARYPIYQYVSANGFVDSTFGIAMEAEIPISRRLNRNDEVQPQVFNLLKLGAHFTAQTVFGYSTLLGGGDDGGLRTLEYGTSLAYAIPRAELALPGVQETFAMFELADETELNKDDPGENSLLGDVGFRVRLKSAGEMQPSLGAAYIFPIDHGAREELHWGVIVSMIFEF